MTTEANSAEDALDKIKTAYGAARGTLPLWDDLEDPYRRALVAMWFAGAKDAYDEAHELWRETIGLAKDQGAD